MKLKQILFSFAGILVFSFLLNFLWESLHGYSLYTDHVIDSDQYVGMMVYMSFLDAVTITVIYVFLALFYKDILWLHQLGRNRIISFVVLGLFVGILAEYWAVYISHQWHYNENMPMIFGIGLSPMVQLSLTGYAAIWLTHRIFFGRKYAF